jgi:hypothetical protein
MPGGVVGEQQCLIAKDFALLPCGKKDWRGRGECGPACAQGSLSSVQANPSLTTVVAKIDWQMVDRSRSIVLHPAEE